ncbi:MAG: carbamoyl phosphate synthase large subunit, partial [Verrucomicrobiales bacterium]|nr:carbamoyl phosphate synthase large subunit [Verrucomicrobiales bacterium]
KVMAGEKLADLGFTAPITPEHYSVKEAVFPFAKFPGIDISLGPEMKSTGEVMGIDADLGMAYAKAQMAASSELPLEGNIFISVKDSDKDAAVELSREFSEMGFTIFSTSGTAKRLADEGVPVHRLPKLAEGRPNVLDMIKNGEIAMVINRPSGRVPRRDEVRIRSGALANRVPIITTMRAARACVGAIRSQKSAELGVMPLQDFHGL